ncbi:DHA2 family efflux MFS transporter permease subunit [Actinosynnema sp. CS-041913]|uniref:DHA2 family efflux MFS transporter permease subunit n=1 Tax=Actinosynnema sp. CS-041913 TaxID=3239917 RepID=UPI003D8ABCBC
MSERPDAVAAGKVAAGAPRKAPGLRALRGNPWAVLSTACLGYFMTILNTGSVSIAIPRIQADLGASLNEVLWMVGAYVLALAVLVITAGKLGDLVGQRAVFLAGMTLFTAASALCGLAGQPWLLIGARLLQGVGAALVIPQALTIVTLAFPPGRRGVAGSVWGVAAALGGVAGPTLGGLVVSTAGWRWIFYLNLPTGVLTVVLTLLLVTDRRGSRAGRLDLLGVVLAGAALGSITFGLLEGERYGFGHVTAFLTIPSILAAGGVLLVLFALWQRRAREPLAPPALFGHRTFPSMCFVVAAVATALMSISLSMTLYLQSVLGLTAVRAGLALAPWAVGVLLGFPFTGRLVDRFGGRVVLVTGLSAYACCLTAIGLLAGAGAGEHALLVPLALAGLSQSAAFAPVVALALRDVAPDLVGAASGVFNAVRQLGTLVAVGGLGALLHGRLDSGIRSAAATASGELPDRYRKPFVDGVVEAAAFGDGAGIGIAPGTPADVALRMHDLAEAAYAQAFGAAVRFTLLVCAALIAVATAVAWASRERAEADVGAV